jgi:K+/H+ antiporter YhaU regulatory subunit KhtT
MASVMALLIIVLLSVVVNRIATVALTLTGLSREMARFQARSAFSTSGFTTNESESIVNHPVRRRIVFTLMMVGNVGFIGVIATSVSSVTSNPSDAPLEFWIRIAWLTTGLSLLLVVSMSKWVDDQLFRLIGWALRRWTMDEVHDFRQILQLGDGYSVTELATDPGDWPIGKRLDELRLSQIGVNVLAIHRSSGEFVGSPIGATYVRKGDRLTVYGSTKDVARFSACRAEKDGARAFQDLMDARAPEVAAAEEERMDEERRRLRWKMLRKTEPEE